MSVRAGAQFTPEQILDAGRRAEAEGRNDYALQFYRHLADQHRGAPETRHALDALARLEPRQPPPSIQAPPAPLVPGPALTIPANAPDYAYPPQQPAPRPRPGGLQHALQSEPSARDSRSPPAHRAPTVALPAPVADYRIGRFGARLITWLGGPILVVGLLAVAAAAVAPAAIAKVPGVGLFLGSPAAGLGAAALGLLMVVGGQLIRAHMEMALSARDIAAMMRAHGDGADHPAEDDDPPPRRKRRRA